MLRLPDATCLCCAATATRVRRPLWPSRSKRVCAFQTFAVNSFVPHYARVQVNEDVLAKSFQPFPSYSKCRIIQDYKKCKTKAFGFVSFLDHAEGAKALRQMHGKYIGNRPCQLKKSTHTARAAPDDANKRRAMMANPLERVTTKRMR